MATVLLYSLYYLILYTVPAEAEGVDTWVVAVLTILWLGGLAAFVIIKNKERIKRRVRTRVKTRRKSNKGSRRTAPAGKHAQGDAAKKNEVQAGGQNMMDGYYEIVYGYHTVRSLCVHASRALHRFEIMNYLEKFLIANNNREVKS